MLTYIDIVSGDELFSDAFKIKVIDDALYEIDCRMITVADDNVDIGANPSADDVPEEFDNNAKTVIDLVHTSRLQPTVFNKKAYVTYIRGYLKRIKAEIAKAEEKKNAESEENASTEEVEEKKNARIKEFEEKIAPKVMQIIKNYESYDFYTGESSDPEGMVALLNYRDDGITPYFTFFKDGLREQKF